MDTLGKLMEIFLLFIIILAALGVAMMSFATYRHQIRERIVYLTEYKNICQKPWETATSTARGPDDIPATTTAK